MAISIDNIDNEGSLSSIIVDPWIVLINFSLLNLLWVIMTITHI